MKILFSLMSFLALSFVSYPTLAAEAIPTVLGTWVTDQTMVTKDFDTMAKAKVDTMAKAKASDVLTFSFLEKGKVLVSHDLVIKGEFQYKVVPEKNQIRLTLGEGPDIEMYEMRYLLENGKMVLDISEIIEPLEVLGSTPVYHFMVRYVEKKSDDAPQVVDDTTDERDLNKDGKVGLFERHAYQVKMEEKKKKAEQEASEKNHVVVFVPEEDERSDIEEIKKGLTEFFYENPRDWLNSDKPKRDARNVQKFVVDKPLAWFQSEGPHEVLKDVEKFLITKPFAWAEKQGIPQGAARFFYHKPKAWVNSDKPKRDARNVQRFLYDKPKAFFKKLF